MPGKFLVFQLATQVKWKIQVNQFDARWPFGLGDSLLIASQKTKRLPPCKKGVIQFAFGHQWKPLFLATWSLDGFPKDHERVGLRIVENIWNRRRVKKQEYKKQQLRWSITHTQSKHCFTYCTNFLLLTTH